MVGYFRQTLATIPETRVFPAPTTRAKCVALQARFRNSMRWSTSRRSLVVLEDAEDRGVENVPSSSVSINAPSFQMQLKGIAWMGARRKPKSEVDVNVTRTGGSDHFHGKNAAARTWSCEPCQRVPSDGFSSDRPLLSKCGRKTWKTAKASISVKGRQIKYALATRPMSIFKDCARKIAYPIPAATDSKAYEELKRSYEIMQA